MKIGKIFLFYFLYKNCRNFPYLSTPELRTRNIVNNEIRLSQNDDDQKNLIGLNTRV